MSNILVITTGGTIESFYNHIDGTPDVVPLEENSCMPEALSSIAKARASLRNGEVTAQQLTQAILDRIDASHMVEEKPYKYIHWPLCMKDSKAVHIPYMTTVARHIKKYKDEHDAIVVVHGTDTMPRNGRALKKFLQNMDINDKKIIFTGSMIPLRDSNKQWNFDSDGWGNIELAMQAANDTSLPADVYIVINKQIYRADDIDKQRTTEDGLVTSASFTKRFSNEPAHPISR